MPMSRSSPIFGHILQPPLLKFDSTHMVVRSARPDRLFSFRMIGDTQIECQDANPVWEDT
jgi:hypothetical protein